MDKSVRVIINADDFGDCVETNKAIADAFDQKLITSTTIMANRPGFEDAIRIAHEKKLTNKIGIHINLTLGHPLTDKIKRYSKFCDKDGMFLRRNKNPIKVFMPLNYDEKKALFHEVKEQIKLCRINGIPLTHADSHNHKHEEWNIIDVLINTLKEEKMHRIRISRNIGLKNNLFNRLYRNILNNKLNKHFKTSEYFGSIDDVKEFHRISNTKKFSYFEIMCHPKLDTKLNIVDNNIELQKKVKFLNDNLKYTPISYNDLH
ncbi:MAG: carbohydrate deacetylase [Bacteroidales bacterium]